MHPALPLRGVSAAGTWGSPFPGTACFPFLKGMVQTERGQTYCASADLLPSPFLTPETTTALSPTAMPRKPLPPLRAGTSCGARTSSPSICALAAAGSSAGGTTPTWVSCAAPRLGERGQSGSALLAVPFRGVSQAWLGRATSRDSPAPRAGWAGAPRPSSAVMEARSTPPSAQLWAWSLAREARWERVAAGWERVAAGMATQALPMSSRLKPGGFRPSPCQEQVRLPGLRHAAAAGAAQPAEVAAGEAERPPPLLYSNTKDKKCMEREMGFLRKRKRKKRNLFYNQYLRRTGHLPSTGGAQASGSPRLAPAM